MDTKEFFLQHTQQIPYDMTALLVQAVPENTPDACSLVTSSPRHCLCYARSFAQVPDENAAKDSGEVEERRCPVFDSLGPALLRRCVRTCQIRGNLTENGHSMGP